MQLEVIPVAVSTPFDTEIIVQFDFGLLAGDAPDRYYDFKYGRERMLYVGDLDTESIRLVDEWQGFAVDITVDGGCAFRMYPIETVSASESGLERTYQGSSINLCARARFEPNGEPFSMKFALTVSAAG